MNDYTCPECKGSGDGNYYLKQVGIMTCLSCRGNGRLLDRRNKTISDRREHNFHRRDRRMNDAFSDRRKKI